MSAITSSFVMVYLRSLATISLLTFLNGCGSENFITPHKDVPDIQDTGDSAVVDTAVEDTGMGRCPWVDYFYQELPDAVDIILVTDKSGSMTGNRDNVRLGIEAIWNELALHPEINWLMGLAPTDITLAETCSGESLSVESTIDDALALYDALGQTVPEEKGFESLEVYAVRNQSVTWLRDREVPLLGVFISDENDQSYSGQTSTEAIQNFESFYTLLRDSVYVASIVHTDETGSCFSDEEGGSPSIGTRYIDVTQDYGGVLVDICSNGQDWAAGLRDATNIMVKGLQDKIQLDHTPIVDTVTVFENGYVIPQDNYWYFDENMNTVYFLQVPLEGTFVEVAYDINLDSEKCPTDYF